jgi:hypothetical protein
MTDETIPSVDEQVATEATPPAEVPNESAGSVASAGESVNLNDAGAAVEFPQPVAAPVDAIAPVTVEAAPVALEPSAGPVFSPHVLSHLEDEAVALFGDAEAFVKNVIAWVATKL